MKAALTGKSERKALDFMEKLAVYREPQRVEGSAGRPVRLSCTASMEDILIRGLIGISGRTGGARVVATVTRGVVAEAARRHGIAGPAAAIHALGRASTAGLLLATLSKSPEERVTIQVLGDGPLGSVTVDADGAGAVRGFVRRPEAGTVQTTTGRPSIARAIGRGVVQVIRDLGIRDQYRGSTTLVSGEIDEDLESYLQTSEQVESALGCDVIVGRTGVAAAGGLLVQCLPDGDVAVVAEARRRLRAGALHDALAAGAVSAVELARAVLGDVDVDVLAEGPVAFRCGCSRERVTGALSLCGEEELRSMIDEDGGAEVTCNFCGERYHVGREELARLVTGIC